MNINGSPGVAATVPFQINSPSLNQINASMTQPAFPELIAQAAGDVEFKSMESKQLRSTISDIVKSFKPDAEGKFGRFTVQSGEAHVGDKTYDVETRVGAGKATLTIADQNDRENAVDVHISLNTRKKFIEIKTDPQSPVNLDQDPDAKIGAVQPLDSPIYDGELKFDELFQKQELAQWVDALTNGTVLAPAGKPRQ